MSLTYTTVESIMDDVKNVSVDSSASVTKAAASILKGGKGAVVVLEKKKAVGIITERDILDRVITAKRDPSKTSVKEVMSTPLITVESNTSLSKAIEFMNRKGIRRLLVTKKGKVEGIVTQRDILLKLMELFKYLFMYSG
jgi:CBS domain-containing protein